jgi:hypothetical protein
LAKASGKLLDLEAVLTQKALQTKTKIPKAKWQRFQTLN